MKSFRRLDIEEHLRDTLLKHYLKKIILDKLCKLLLMKHIRFLFSRREHPLQEADEEAT